MLTKKINDSIEFIKKQHEITGNMNFVLGVSGGLDSAVVLKLAIEAVGVDKVYAVLLPTKLNRNFHDAVELVESLGVKYEAINIKDVIDSYFGKINDIYDNNHNLFKLRYGNFAARVRMSILYDKALMRNSLVLGTNNLSEYYLGYFTKWGDGASDLEPIMNFTKTELFEVAKLLGLPETFYTKEPTADLWEGQTDENEMGLTYSEVDKIIDNFPNIDIDEFVGTPFFERFSKNTHKTSPIPTNWRK